MLSEMTPSFVLCELKPATAAYMAPRMLMVVSSFLLRRRSSGGPNGDLGLVGLRLIGDNDEPSLLADSLGIDEAIPLAGECLDVVFTTREGAQLLADLAHHYIDGLLVDRAAVIAVDVVVDEAPVDDAAVAEDEALEQLPLAPA